MNKKAFIGLSIISATGIISASVVGIVRGNIASAVNALRPIDNPYTFVINSANGDFARNYHLDTYGSKCFTNETSLGNPINFSYTGIVNETTGCLEPELFIEEYDEDGIHYQKSYYVIELSNYCDHLEDGTITDVFNNITSITVDFTGCESISLYAGTYTYDIDHDSDHYTTYNFDTNQEEMELLSGVTYEFSQEKDFPNYFSLESLFEEHLSISKITITYLCN